MPFPLFKRRFQTQKRNVRQEQERKHIFPHQHQRHKHHQEQEENEEICLRELSQYEHWLSKQEDEGWSKLPWTHPQRARGRTRYLHRYFDPPRSENQLDLGTGLLRRVCEQYERLRTCRPDPVNHTDDMDGLLDVLEECGIALGSIQHRNGWLRQELHGLEDSLRLCDQQREALTTRVTDLVRDVNVARERCRGLERRGIHRDLYDRMRSGSEAHSGASVGEGSRPPSYHAGDAASRPPSYHVIDTENDDDDNDNEWREIY